MDELKENLKTLLRKAINNAKDGDEKGEWITINGTHVFIPDGANQEEVVKEFLDKKRKEDKAKWKSYDEVLDHAKKQLELVESKLKENNSPKKHDELVSDKKELEDKIKYYEERKKEEKGEGKEKTDNPDDELVKLDIPDKPTKEAQEAIDRDREKAQKAAEERKKEYEKSKDIDLSKLKLEKTSEGKKTNNSIKNGLSKIIKNCKPKTKEDLKILKGLKDILEKQ